MTLGRVELAPSLVVGIWGKLLLVFRSVTCHSPGALVIVFLPPAAYTLGAAQRNQLQGLIIYFFPLMIASDPPPPPPSPMGHLSAAVRLHSALSP